jgi:hypothetical protein
MQFRIVFYLAVGFLAFTQFGCQKDLAREASLSIEDSNKVSVEIDTGRILVDASRDGGVWWFPQSPLTGFSASDDHQGKYLADWLVSQGYIVDELPRDTLITANLLARYNKVIRAGSIVTPYTTGEIQAYDDYLNRGGALLLAQDHLAYYPNDDLSEHLGVHFAGVAKGTVTQFASHDITVGVTGFPYLVGSGVTNALNNPDITVIGSLDSSSFLDLNNNGILDQNEIVAPVVMGIVNKYPKSRIFFIGDLNTLEVIPQPFTDNLLKWLFRK